jgi:hypothetical protein
MRAHQPGASNETTGNDGDDNDADYDRREYELAELGLPNDGYDYFQHLRDVGSQYMSTLPPEATMASTVFLPENVTVYKRGVDALDKQRMSLAASRVRVKDVAELDHATSSALDVDNAGILVADADTEIDLEIIHALNHIEDEQLEELGDDFFLLANDGFGWRAGAHREASHRPQWQTHVLKLAPTLVERSSKIWSDDDDDDDDDDGDFDDDDDDDERYSDEDTSMTKITLQ